MENRWNESAKRGNKKGKPENSLFGLFLIWHTIYNFVIYVHRYKLCNDFFFNLKTAVCDND